MNFRVLSFSLLTAVFSSASAATADDALQLDMHNYPVMSDRELGQLRYQIKIAQQELDDFSLIPLSDMYGIKGSGRQQAGMSSARYTLGFMAYFLALEQFAKLPAYTELLQPVMDRLIQKMLRRIVWDYWAEVSRGEPAAEPNWDRPYPEEHDPIANRNIMYSGHLAHMISLYEKLYSDFKWAKPGSLSFAWTDKEVYSYDTHLLHKAIYDQFVRLPDHAIECAPNTAFPVCNQHPLLALLLYDQNYHTSYFPTARRLHAQFYIDNAIYDPTDHSVAGMLMVKQHTLINRRDPHYDNPMDLIIRPLNFMHIIQAFTVAVDGWNGAFMNSWAPQVVKEHYPFQKKEYVVVKDEKTAAIVHKGIYDQISAPFFAVLAAEMGDLKLRDQLLNWASFKFKAQWDNEGDYFYPPGMDMPFTVWPSTRFRGIPLTDKLAGLASANSKDGIRNLHLAPFAGADPQHPRIEGVSYPTLLIKRAIYDPTVKALIVTTKPGRPAFSSRQGSLKVTRLDPQRTWNLYVDGHKSATYSNVRQITLAVDLKVQHDLVLQAQ